MLHNIAQVPGITNLFLVPRMSLQLLLQTVGGAVIDFRSHLFQTGLSVQRPLRHSLSENTEKNKTLFLLYFNVINNIVIKIKNDNIINMKNIFFKNS